MEIKPFEVTDFSGGITDNYLDGPDNKARYKDNFIIQYNGQQSKLFTRPGSLIYDEANEQIPLGAQRVSTLVSYNGDLLAHSANKIWDVNDSFNETVGPVGSIFSTATATTKMAYALWNKHIIVSNDNYEKPAKMYRDDVGDFQARTAGLPVLASSPTVTVVAGAGSYIWAFHYTYTYQVGSLTFIDNGPITYVQKESAAAPNLSAVSIAAIPELTNGAGDNYDVVDIKVNIFRTIDGGTTFYKLTELANGVAIYSDTTGDGALQENDLIYNNGGLLEQSPPPLCKYVHTVNNTTYYANVKEGTVIYDNRIYQSIHNNPDGVPLEFVIDIEDEILGISSYNFSPVIGCREGMYRIDGTYLADGSGVATTQKIRDAVGLLSHHSFVQTAYGLFFAGTDGFYFTDGFECFKVSKDIDKRYRDIIAEFAPEDIYGTYDKVRNRVLWGVRGIADSLDNDVIYCLDLNFGVSKSMPFTTWSNVDSFAPSSLAFFDKQIIRGDRRGYIFKHLETVVTDPRVDVATAASTWQVKTIIYNYVSCAFKFGTSFVRKWVSRIVVTADNETNLALQINAINDDGRATRYLKPIKFENAIVWGDDTVWGNSTLIWNFDGLIDEWRRMPGGGLRCSYLQVQLTNAKVIVDSSTSSGQVVVDSTAKTATLVSAAIADFPTNAVDHFITFSSDNYTQEYLIIARTDDTVTYEDDDNLSSSGTYDWQIKGYPKGQVLNLLQYCLHYAHLGKTQKPYQGEA